MCFWRLIYLGGVFRKPALYQGMSQLCIRAQLYGLRENCKGWSKKCQGTALQLAGKCKWWSKKRQGTASAVPQMATK
jgi:hypothetical protein